MITNSLKYAYFFGFLALLIACSTKKDKLINRKFQALNTKYNVLYNGNLALDKGIEDLKLKYNDNFWEILPIERMQVTADNILPGQTKNANFERAEEKATKAIQRRSMNIDGKEKNPQIDEAHLLLGKARYYDQRFVPALEAFNYILYKYPESDKIYEAKIWRERTNMRMENDALAVKNLRKLLGEIQFKDQVFADANATLAQAFLNLEQKDSAVVRLRMAKEYTKSDEEKARYTFILGQLYDEFGQKDSAFVAFQSIIDMKRKSPRRYIIQAHAKQAQQFDLEKGDTIAFLKKFDELLEDRENRPFLDVLNHQKALFYEKQNNNKQAIVFYNESLKSKSQDQYLTASNYRNLADIYFDTAKYQTAGNYYDSTLVRLELRTREHKYIKKKRENLEDVIKYEEIAQKNDSILNVVSLSESDQKSFYEAYIVNLKKAEAAQAKLEKAKQEKLDRQKDASDSDDANEPTITKSDGNKKFDASADQNSRLPEAKKSEPISKNKSSPPGSSNPVTGKKDEVGAFYFYNPTTVAFGKVEYKKKWGDRILKNNWRLSSLSKNKDGEKVTDEEEKQEETTVDKGKPEIEVEDKYTADFYIKQLPTLKKVLDSLAKERNFAYYQLGVVYKEKFKEYKLAESKLEQLLRNNPEERLVLPAMYNLYKIYEIIDKEKASIMQSKIVTQFPNSRYAFILSNSATDPEVLKQSSEAVYQGLFKTYQEGNYFKVLEDLETTITQFTGDEIVPKMELLKANVIGKIDGLTEFKTALNFVALNYPSTDEGKKAEQIVTKEVPKLEALQFDLEKPLSWKIIFKVSNISNPKTKALLDKIKKFVSERTSEKLTNSIDIYNRKENFIVIHGIALEQTAKDIATILKDYKDYQIAEKAIVISNENYKIVQIKKNLEEFLSPRVAPVVPVGQPEQANSKATPKQQGPPKSNMLPPQKDNNDQNDKKTQAAQKPNIDPVYEDDPQPELTPPTPKKRP